MTSSRYTKFLLLVAGLGGLLYGIDFGVIAVSMPYIKALRYYTDAQVSWIVGAVMFGGILSSLTAGVLCDKLGRKTMIIAAAAMIIVLRPSLSHSTPAVSDERIPPNITAPTIQLTCASE